VIWDNGLAHRGEALRIYLATPGLQLWLGPLPAYRPDFNAEEAIGGWVRAEVTAKRCLGTKDAVQQPVGRCFTALAERTAEVQRRCRTVRHALAEPLLPAARSLLQDPKHVGSVMALV
jgi:hypothetical protein